MNILLPTTITESMIGAGTNVPSVDASVGEVAWNPAAHAYAIDDLVAYSGAIYSCVKAYTSAANPTPDNDAVNWLFKSPTNRMAPFDEYIYTAARRAGLLKYVLTPPFFNGFAMYGAEADHIDVTLRDQAGGVVLVSRSQEMWEQAFGEWEYLFGNLQRTTKLTQSGLPMRPAAELEISLTRNNPAVLAELGFLSVGQWQQMLAPVDNIPGTQYGAEVTPKSYSYFKLNDDGTYTRRKGRTAKVITASVLIDAQEAPRVSRLLEKIMDIPVAIEASSLPRYGHISTVGFVTGSVVAESFGIARVNLKVDGNV